MTIGLLIAINGFIVWWWSGEPQALASVRDGHGRNRRDRRLVSGHRLRSTVTLGIVVLLWLLFEFTKVGLALRAARSLNEARLVGVRVTWMLALGWGLARRSGGGGDSRPRAWASTRR